MCVAAVGRQEENVIMKKYCTKCGKPFDAVGREVICPSCKAQAAEETKRAAVLKAKRASWSGESVPVRISGRASTIIREYSAAHNMPFAASLDALIRTTEFFLFLDKAWVDVVPYKSHRRDRHATDATQDTPQTAQDTADADAAQDTPDTPDTVQEVKTAQDVPKEEVKQAAKQTSKASASKAATSKTAGKAASKTSSKAAKK